MLHWQWSSCQLARTENFKSSRNFSTDHFRALFERNIRKRDDANRYHGCKYHAETLVSSGSRVSSWSLSIARSWTTLELLYRQDFSSLEYAEKKGFTGRDKLSVDFWTETWKHCFDYNIGGEYLEYHGRSALFTSRRYRPTEASKRPLGEKPFPRQMRTKYATPL